MPLDGDLIKTEQRFQHATGSAVIPLGRASKASGGCRLPWFLSLAFFVLACIALQQPAAAQTITLAATTVDENQNAQIVVRVSNGDVSPALDLSLSFTSGSAVLGTDTVGDLPTEVSVSTEGTYTLPDLLVEINDDNLVESTETFTVTLSVPDGTDLPGGVTIGPITGDGTSHTRLVTILDNDSTRVSLNPTTARAAEGEMITFTVTLDNPVVVPFRVAWRADSGTAAVGDDLEGNPTGEVTIPANARTAPFSIPVAVDQLHEPDEQTFTVRLTGGPLGLVGGVDASQIVINSTTTATGTITGDVTGSTVSIGGGDPDADEGDLSVTFTVLLTAAVDSDVVLDIDVTFTGDTPAGLADLGTPPETVTIISGATRASFEVPIIDDTIVEALEETFTVTLTANSDNPLPDGVVIGDGVAVVTITDNDGSTTPPTPPTQPPTPPTGTPPTGTGPTVSIADTRADEDDGIATFTVTLSRAVDSNVVLDIAYAAGSADPATDLWAGRPGAVTVAASDTTATFDVPIRDDDLVEGDETFTVTIAVNTASAATGTTVADGTAEGTIVDDDGSMVTLSPATQTAAEDGSFAYTVSISAAADEAIGITWTAVDGTATVADDLRSATGTVTFPADTTAAQTFTIAVADDDVAEADETFTVTLAPTGVLPAGVMIAAATSTATITDNDDPSLVNISDADVDEDNGNATFTVTLSEAVDGNVVLGITYAAGSADPATDLGTGRPATVTIAANRTSATFDVPITNDAIVEGEETFTVTVTVNTAPGGVSIADGTGEGTIADDDRALVTLTPPAQTAGEDGSFSYTIDLSAAVAEAVAITWTAADGTATVADDLRSATGTVTFPADTSAARTFTITVVDDDAPEADETFTVTLSAVGTLPAGVTVDEGNATSTATIADNDTPASASIADAAQAEGGGNVTFTVTLSEAVDSNVVLGIAYAAGSADLTTDLGAGRPATVTIGANRTSATFGVPIIDDDVFEDDETFTVTLSGDNLPASVVVGTATATGTIRNDDFTSVLADTRRSAAMSALRRHTGRFERLTSNAANSRLRGQSPSNGGGVSDGAASGSVARGFDFGDEWNGWLDGSFAGFDGDSEGRQVDLYVGADHLSATGRMVWGVMLGIESAQLDVGPAEYEANHLQVGVYGGVFLTDTLVWDGAISYGTSTPDISRQGISADYDAQRLSIRSDLTGGAHALLASGALTVAPQVGVSYIRESLGGFVDSAGGRASEEVLELGRIGAGPRFAWRLDGTRELVSSARFQWDMLRDDEDNDTALSGTVDVGARFNPTPELAIGVYVEADGIGNTDKYAAYGGRFELRAVF